MSGDALAEYAGLTEQELAHLLAILSGTDIVELDVSVDTAHFHVRRPASISSAVLAAEPVEDQSTTLAVTSPLVGIFRPAVGAGQHIQAGQAIGAVEALGMPTTVDAPQSGSVDQLLVEGGQPVEYGQPLLVLRRE